MQMYNRVEEVEGMVEESIAQPSSSSSAQMPLISVLTTSKYGSSQEVVLSIEHFEYHASSRCGILSCDLYVDEHSI